MYVHICAYARVECLCVYVYDLCVLVGQLSPGSDPLCVSAYTSV